MAGTAKTERIDLPYRLTYVDGCMAGQVATLATDVEAALAHADRLRGIVRARFKVQRRVDDGGRAVWFDVTKPE